MRRALLALAGQVLVVMVLALVLEDTGLAGAALGVLGAAVHQEWGLPATRRWVGTAGAYARPTLLSAALDLALAALCAGVWSSPFLAGWLATEGLYELWRWWNHDDRKPQRDAVRNKVAWRRFAPSPIPSVGGA